MLLLWRHKNQTITIEPDGGLDPDLTLRQAFGSGPIEIRLITAGRQKARLAISAPQALKIWRGTGAAASNEDENPATELGYESPITE